MILKIIKAILRISFLVIFAVIIFSYAIGMFKNNKNFCSKYIPHIEHHYKVHGEYPTDLTSYNISFIDFRYKPQDCHYKHNETSYTFYGSDGYMGVLGYSSIDKKWWYD